MCGKGGYANPLLSLFALSDGSRQKTEVATFIAEDPKCRIFLFGRGKQEEQTFTMWCERYSQCTYVGKHLETMYQELVLMSHLDVMVSMDSANMHMASLVDTPVVSVWGATHPYAGFMGWNQSMDNVVQLDMPCRPCSIFGNKPCLRGDFACMNQIKPESIIDKVNILLTIKKKGTIK